MYFCWLIGYFAVVACWQRVTAAAEAESRRLLIVAHSDLESG